MRDALILSGFVLVSSAACAKEAATGSPGASLPATPATSSPAPADTPAVAEEGKPAPRFDVQAHDGTRLDSSALRGKWLVVYFYPKDETPGCTKEACAFRDAWDVLGKKAVLVGVSADSAESHRAFAKHHGLPFHLVTDADGSLAAKFGVPFSGMHARQTIVVAPDGTVKRIYRTVDVTKHAAEITADVSS
jgi:peroxiredoxin Q/BCP